MRTTKETKMTKELDRLRKLSGMPITEDCDQEAEKNDDGECSPFTHGDKNVDMVREGDNCPECDGIGEVWGKPCEVCGGDVEEDMLVPPKGSESDAWSGHDTADYANSVGDDDDRIEPELDRQTDFNAPPRDDGDDYLGDDANTKVSSSTQLGKS